ncbi:MAG: DnaA regulatory inactivator Hda [Gammaproteobacteria bacterium]|nr:DnaA regulatory inactivator Hda [Gammaproteobacteria bacterium]MCW8911319.1 DnaA regulatory inactivator Hda [Gammaproteobacteria bacterium]MCW9004136.1 DnaA regulatory inactivator Hda [Gammaproteobacteria bacterium]MCW9055213.1 DnaA regulatory inactivator Hda [Gammaproteobacteria bacterium]
MTSTQLVLDLKLRESYSFNNFVTGDNRLLIDLLQQISAANGEQQILIWGDEFTGKSHLLQAVCQAAAIRNLITAYLPLKQIIQCSDEAFEGLEKIDIVCVDDVQMVSQKPDWQKNIFDLINRMREAEKRLVFTSNLPPNEMDIHLEDLRSRLNWGPVIKIKSLSDEQKQQALQLRAESRGFELPDNVASYILNNFSRDMPGLFEKLEQLDQLSLQQQRRLTVPFVKTVFE